VRSIKENGLFSLYNGVSAALLRQATYSTVRFAFYEFAKERLLHRSNKTSLAFFEKVIIAGIGGGLGNKCNNKYIVIIVVITLVHST
jgi:dicarboxylate transporter 10